MFPLVFFHQKVSPHLRHHRGGNCCSCDSTHAGDTVQGLASWRWSQGCGGLGNEGLDLDVSKNRDNPKCMVYNRKPYQNGMIRGYQYFRKHPFECPTNPIAEHQMIIGGVFLSPPISERYLASITIRKEPPGKGYSFCKPSFAGSMLNFRV